MNFYQRQSAYYCDFRVNGKRIRKLMPDVTCDEEAEVEVQHLYDLAVVRQLEWLPIAEQLRCTPVNLGAMCELLACADLLRRNFDVYHSITRRGKFDLIAVRSGVMCRVEVKTARRINGTVRAAQLRPDQRGTHDVIAYVFINEGKVEYTPDIDKWFEGK